MTQYNTHARARSRELAEIGRDLHARGWVPATSGNLSMRLGPDRALVTASGRHKGRLEDSDFLVVDLDGQPWRDASAAEAPTPARPSAETLLHTQLYALLPEVDTVLHCHSPAATVLSRQLADQQELTLADYELLKAFPGITTHATTVTVPIFDNEQDMPSLAAKTAPYIGGRPACPAYLIRGHGVYAWGDSAAACMRHLEALDFLLQCELLHMQLGR